MASFKGITILGPQAATGPLSAVMKAFDIILQETNGKLFFKTRASLSEIAVVAEDVAAHSPGDTVPRKVTITDVKDISMPKEVNVEHIEPQLDYQSGSQRERRINVDTDNVTTVRLPIVLTAQEAREVAMRELWTSWSNKQRMHLSLPPSYKHVLESDILNVPVGSETYRVLITKLEHGRTGLMVFEGDIESSETRDFSPGVYPPIGPTASIGFPSMLLFAWFDIPPLSDNNIYEVGVYAAACNWITTAPPVGAGSAAITRWRGGKYYHSRDDITFNATSSAEIEATLGRAETVLPAATGYFWDRINTLDVEVFGGNNTLLSVDDIDVINGENWALLGTEIIGFKTATLLGTGQYRLSTLLRGLRNTEAEMSTHIIGDIFIPLTGASVSFIPISATLLGSTNYYKAASEGIDLSDVESQSFTLEGNTVKPFSPDALKKSLDASDNATFTWVRRTRRQTNLLAPIRTPLEEPFEKYEIDFYDGATIVRTVEITDATTYTYSAANQTSDGLTPGNPIKFELFQIGATLGRGRVAADTL